MSREIKFRAWDSFAKKFKYGKRVIDHYTNWEQSTGLKDKNGKEIYEGDIVRLYGRFISAISWQDGYCGFRWYNNSGDGYCSLSKDNKEYYEVIGNIHDNPELLGDEE